MRPAWPWQDDYLQAAKSALSIELCTGTQAEPVRVSVFYVHTGILGYIWQQLGKVLEFPEGKELLLINMAGTREIEYTLVPNTNEKSDP